MSTLTSTRILLLASLGAFALPACDLLKFKGSTNTPGDPAAGDGAADREAAAAKRRSDAAAWYERCSAEYDAFLAAWKPIDDEAKAAIAQTRDKTFFEAYPRLAGQYAKTRAESRRLLGEFNLPSSYGDGRGTGLELLLAIAELQLRTDHTHAVAFEAGKDRYRNALPLTGDDAFDRTNFCALAVSEGTRGNYQGIGKLEPFDRNAGDWSAPWMTREAEAAWSARVREQLERNTARLRELEQRDAARGTLGGEYGVVKKLKKQPDGSVRVDAKAIDTPYECQHTGNYQWTGTMWSDCTYVDLAPAETYAFSVVFAADELPAGGVAVGDKFSFLGRFTKGSLGERAGAAYEDVMLTALYRRGKALFEGIGGKIDR